MSANQFVMCFVVLWAALVGVSFLHTWTYDPSGQGLAGGFTMIFIFFGWQIAALLAAFVAMIIRLVRNADVTGWVRWLGFVPVVLSSGFALFIVIWVVVQS